MYAHTYYYNAHNPCSKQKEHKHAMIAHPHTVVDPGTVVVKPLHAHVADCAVARTRGADHLAVGA